MWRRAASPSTGSRQRPGSVILSGCGAPSSAASASRRRRCGAPHGHEPLFPVRKRRPYLLTRACRALGHRLPWLITLVPFLFLTVDALRLIYRADVTVQAERMGLDVS